MCRRYIWNDYKLEVRLFERDRLMDEGIKYQVFVSSTYTDLIEERISLTNNSRGIKTI